MANTTNKNLNVPAHGSFANDWDVPVNQNWNDIDAAFGGSTALSVTGASGVVALTATQYTPPNLEISGTLTAAVNYQLPSGVGGAWSISNAATGAFAVTFSSAAGGATVTLAQGVRTAVIADGTSAGVSLYSTTTPAGGTNTQVQFNSGGSLAGSANLTFDGTNLSAAAFQGPLGSVTPAAATVTALTASGAVALAGASSVTVPTAAAGTNTTAAASTAFVKQNATSFANSGSYAVAGGTANAITATYSPAITALTDGLNLRVKIATNNTSTAPTFSPNGLSAAPIVTSVLGPLFPSQLEANFEADLTYNSAIPQWIWTNSGTSQSDIYLAPAFATGSPTAALGTQGSHGFRFTATGTLINWTTIQLEDGGAGTGSNAATWTYDNPLLNKIIGIRHTNLSCMSGQNNATTQVQNAVLSVYSIGLTSASLGVHNTASSGNQCWMYVEIEGY